MQCRYCRQALDVNHDTVQDRNMQARHGKYLELPEPYAMQVLQAGFWMQIMTRYRIGTCRHGI
jgi:hypothetical protein